VTTASAVDLVGELIVFPRTLKGLKVRQEGNGRDRIGGKGRRRERIKGEGRKRRMQRKSSYASCFSQSVMSP